MIPTVGYNWQRPAVVPGVARTSEEIDTDRKVEKAITARTTADASAKTAKDTKSDANTATAKAEKAEAEAAAATISLAKAKVTRVNISLPEDKEPTAVFEEIEDHELFKANETNLATYNKVIVNQVVLGGMLLPIKIRPAREFNGVQYERHFATDVSVGPFVGYRFKFKGNNYNSFTTLGLFAGPTLIDYVSTVSQTGSPTNGVNPDNMFAFTYGIGLVHEINGFQMGIVYGSDRVSGKRVKEWPYDGDGWFSLAIGYNFLSGRVR
jgi:hypothetical protein